MSDNLTPDPLGPIPTPAPTPAGGAPLNYAAATAGPGAYTGPTPDPDARTMGMLAHLLGIVTGFLGPLIIWLVKKDTSPFVNDQGKEALNWEINVTAAYIILEVFSIIVGVVLHSAIIGCFFGLVMLAIFICNLIFTIQGGLSANKGVAYRYPFVIRLIK